MPSGRPAPGRPGQRDVVVEPVSASEAEVAVITRIGASQVARAPPDRRKGPDGLVGNDGRCAGSIAVQDQVSSCLDRQRIQDDSRFHQCEGEPGVLAEGDLDVRLDFLLVAENGSRNGVRAADSHAPDRKHPPGTRSRLVSGAAWFMERSDCDTGQRQGRGVRYNAVDSA